MAETLNVLVHRLDLSEGTMDRNDLYMETRTSIDDFLRNIGCCLMPYGSENDVETGRENPSTVVDEAGKWNEETLGNLERAEKTLRSLAEKTGIAGRDACLAETVKAIETAMDGLTETDKRDYETAKYCLRHAAGTLDNHFSYGDHRLIVIDAGTLSERFTVSMEKEMLADIRQNPGRYAIIRYCYD